MKKFIAAGAAVLSLSGASNATDRPHLFFRPKRECPSADACPPCPPETSPAVPRDSMPRSADSSLTEPPGSAFNAALASAPEAGTQPTASFSPAFFGDLLPSLIVTPVLVPELPSSLGSGLMASPNPSQAGGIKSAEGDSPRPMNRIYYFYNYFGNIEVNAITPFLPRLQVHRHIIGVEKTFLGGDGSIGLRLPFFSFSGDSIAYRTGFTGDLSVITKYAIVNNRETGNLISAGLIVTAPTGGSPNLFTGGNPPRPEQVRYRNVQLTPFAGYMVNAPKQRLYLQGLHSATIPTGNQEPTFLSNSVSVGYWVVREPRAEFIQGFIPTFEVHINTPLSHLSATMSGEVLMRNSTNLTTGAYLLLPRSIVGGAVSVPLAWGPHRIEALASWTFRF